MRREGSDFVVTALSKSFRLILMSRRDYVERTVVDPGAIYSTG